MSFELVVQSAIFDHLKLDVELVSKGVAIYDDTPQASDSGEQTSYPYVVVGDDQANDWSTDSENGVDAVVTIHTWSRYSGKKEVKELQGIIYNALHNIDLQVMVGYSAPVCVFLQSQTFLDADGVTRHGIQTFKLMVEEL